jgi:hypothetical protein
MNTRPRIDEYDSRMRVLAAEGLRGTREATREELLRQDMREVIRLLADLLTNPGPTDAEVAARRGREVTS